MQSKQQNQGDTKQAEHMGKRRAHFMAAQFGRTYLCPFRKKLDL